MSIDSTLTTYDYITLSLEQINNETRSLVTLLDTPVTSEIHDKDRGNFMPTLEDVGKRVWRDERGKHDWFYEC